MTAALTELCLQTIIEYFPRYNLAFHRTKDNDMKRRFEFLQRKYSFELLTRLSVKLESFEEYVDLLVNKHLKVLDTAWLRNCTWEKVTSKIAEIGSNVEKIILNNMHFEDIVEDTPWGCIICYLPNLKSFTFRDDCDGLILENVAKFCRDIKEIDIEDTLISDFQSIKNFCKNEDGEALCTNLKKFRTSHISDDHLKYLIKNLPSLEVIDIDESQLPLALYSLHKNDLLSLDKVKPYNFTELDLITIRSRPSFTDIKKICLSVCPYLKSLSYALFDKEELKNFCKLSDLEQLHIQNYSYSVISINDLLINKGKLTSLTVSDCTASVSLIAENCPLLEKLTVRRISFLADTHTKPVFNSLSTFKMDCCNISMSDRAVSSLLSSSGKLESLTFQACYSFTLDAKAHILKCCETCPIKEISFFGSAIEKDYLKDILLRCRTLTSLHIHNYVDKDHREELSQFAEILPNKPKVFWIPNELFDI